MTARKLIRASLRVIGAIAPGETPPAEEIDDGLEALNLMLDGWSIERTIVYAVTKKNFSLTKGQGSYTYGSGGDFSGSRPLLIEDAYVRSSNVDYPVSVRTTEDYNRVATKDTEGRPKKLVYVSAYPLGTVYLSPTPDLAYTLFCDVWEPFSKFSSADSQVSFPPGYERALKYNLAVEVASEYGVAVTPEVAVLAGETRKRIEAINAANNIKTATFEDIPGVVYTGIHE